MRVVIFSMLLCVLAISVASADAPTTSVADHIHHPGQRQQCVAWCQMQFGQQVCNTYCY